MQIYPFVPTPARLMQEKDSPHAAFWSLLARMELDGKPPRPGSGGVQERQPGFGQ
ncbi:hypothetical protein [Bacteroides caccae]|uniref:hypothetical protein n=1 Tax=Bacteroides caccae TaxID=47678 RepID=UPI00129D1A6C